MPNPPDKVMFPELTPDIRADDGRVIEIAEKMRRQILEPPKGVNPKELEFEVKLG